MIDGIKRLLTLYPDDPSLGSPLPQLTPHRTPVIAPHHGAIPMPPPMKAGRMFPPVESNQFERMSVIFGDWIFDSGRRALLQALVDREDIDGPEAQAWSYHFRHQLSTAPSHYGVHHASEMDYGMFAIPISHARLTYVLPF